MLVVMSAAEALAFGSFLNFDRGLVYLYQFGWLFNLQCPFSSLFSELVYVGLAGEMPHLLDYSHRNC